MTGILTIVFITIPLLYFLLVFKSETDQNGMAVFNLWGGLIILFIFMLLFPYVESNDKPLYLESYLDAENYYEDYDRELLWGKIQIFLSKVLFKSELLYWYFYSVVYCFSYYIVAQKFFPYQYAGYFVLCAVACLGFVNYGSNTIRAGFGIALLLLSFCSDKKYVKIGLAFAAVGCHLTMLLPIVGYLTAGYIMKRERWCELVWILFLIVSILTSTLSDIMSLIGNIDNRADAFENDDVYNTGFRIDFLLYSLVPALFARYNINKMSERDSIYTQVYRAYILVNAVWVLLIRMPYTDRVAYLSWFMIPFLLLYPILNGLIYLRNPQSYLYRTIAVFMFVGIILLLKSHG